MSCTSPGARYSRYIRGVLPQCCNIPGIQKTFTEHFKGKYFLKNSRSNSCFCVKSVWFDDNKCWSFGKFQLSQCFQNIRWTFHEFLFQKYSKDFPGILQGYENIFMKSKSAKNCFVGFPVEILILVVSSWNVFLSSIKTIFHLE